MDEGKGPDRRLALAAARAAATRMPGSPALWDAWLAEAARLGCVGPELDALRLLVPAAGAGGTRAYLGLVRRHARILGDPGLQVAAPDRVEAGPGGRTVLLTGRTGSVRLYDGATAACLARLELARPVRSVAWDAQARPLLAQVGAGGEVRVVRIEADGSSASWEAPAPPGALSGVLLGAAGARLVAMGPALGAWAAPRPTREGARGSLVPVSGPHPLQLAEARALSPCGRRLFAPREKTSFWDTPEPWLVDLEADRWQEFRPNPVARVEHAWSPDGRWLVMAWDADAFFDPISDPDQLPPPVLRPEVVVVELATGTRRQFALPEDADPRATLDPLVWVDDGSLALGRYRVDPAAGTGRLAGGAAPVAPGPAEGPVLAGVLAANRIRGWGPVTPGPADDPVRGPLGHAHHVVGVEALPDGRILTRDVAGRRLVWDPASGRVEAAPPPPGGDGRPGPPLADGPLDAADPGGAGRWVAAGCMLRLEPAAG